MKGSIQASTMWGIEGHGMPPQRRQQARVALARCIGLKTKGSVDIVFDIQHHHQDPGDLAFERQVKTFRHLVLHWPEDQQGHLQNAWKATRERLDKATHTWQVVYGPMAALQAYLEEGQWNFEDMERWVKRGDQPAHHMQIHIHDPWPAIKETLMRDARIRRLQRIARYRDCTFIKEPLDWKIHRQISKKGTPKQENALMVWHQGSLQTHATRDELGVCPICHVPATATHLIWQCKWMAEKRGPLREEWKADLESGERKEFWERGLIQTPVFNWATGNFAMEGLGSWTGCEKIALQDGDKVVIQVQATAKDSRLKMYVVSLVHYNATNERQGVLNGIAPGKQQPARAWLYALLMLANHISTSTTVHVKNGAAFQAWQETRVAKGLEDILCWKPEGGHRQVRAIMIEKRLQPKLYKQAAKAREKDAKQANNESVNDWQQPEIEKALQKSDKANEQIYYEACERVSILLHDKTHFFHVKEASAKEKRAKTRGEKRQLYESFAEPAAQDSHRWQAGKRCFQCIDCQKRVTIQNPFTMLQQAKEEKCPRQGTSTGPVGGKKETRDEFLGNLIRQQREGEGQHSWRIEGHYLRCHNCGNSGLKRIKMEDLQKMLETRCFNGPFEKPRDWDGHPSHDLWRRGLNVHCQKCEVKAVRREGQFQAPKRLQERCTKVNTPTLRSFFSASGP